MFKTIIHKLVQVRNFAIYKKYNVLALYTNKPMPVDLKANFVVSIASYPKRDPLLPAVFQALSKQTVVPQKWVLVLSVEDYPNGLPQHLSKLENRGVEILWVVNNPYAVKKLIPVIKKYSQLGIVTLDDDIIYHQSLLGKAILQKEGELDMFYRESSPADLTTKSEQVYLIGWGGIYYPPRSLDKRVLNMQAVHKIVPGRGSDIWFWAAAHAKGTEQVCLGVPKNYNLGVPIPQNDDTKPKDQPAQDVLLDRFQMAVDYFGIKEQLLDVLPDEQS